MRKLLWTLLGLFFSILLMLLWALGTTSGVKSSLQLLGYLSNTHIEVEQLDGNWLQTLSAQGIRIERGPLHAQLASFNFSRQTLRMQLKQIHINRLEHQFDAQLSLSGDWPTYKLNTQIDSPDMRFTATSDTSYWQIAMGHATLNIPNLHSINPSWMGQFKLQSDWKNQQGQLQFQDELHIQQLLWNTVSLGTLKAQLTHTLAFEPATLDAKLEHLKLSTQHELKHISLRAEQTPGHHFQAKLQTNPKGAVTISGKLNPRKRSANLTLKGEHLALNDLSQATVELAPNLKLKGKNNRWHVSGDLNIPQAHLQHIKTASLIKLPPNTVIHKQSHPAAKPVLDVDMQVVIGNPDAENPKDVSYTTSSLKAYFQGQLHLQGRTDQTLQATGKINITSGYYQAYGRKLKLKQGSLLYQQQALDKPSVALEAVLPLENNKDLSSVGLQLTGSPDDFHITPFSEPAGLPQTEILSYLIFGEASDKVLKEAQSVILFKALSNIKLGKGPGMVDRLKTGLKLDELSVSTHVSDTELSKPKSASQALEQLNPAITLGKFLSPKLYMEYGLGLMDSLYTLSLTYFIKPELSLKSTTNSDAQALHVLYSFERD